jgi:hypothetical protein
MKRRDRRPFGPLPEGDDAPAEWKLLGTHSRMAVVLKCMEWALMKESYGDSAFVYMICYHAVQVRQETCIIDHRPLLPFIYFDPLFPFIYFDPCNTISWVIGIGAAPPISVPLPPSPP